MKRITEEGSKQLQQYRNGTNSLSPMMKRKTVSTKLRELVKLKRKRLHWPTYRCKHSTPAVLQL